MEINGEGMGKILTTITVTNHADEILAAAGVINRAQIRSLTILDVLIDTGPTTLCLAPDLIRQLGLKPVRAVPVSTARGVAETHIYEDAKISLLGREGTFECLELPGGTQPLLGVIPMESMGIEPDLRTQSLRLLPLENNNTYLTIM
ncbi:MAG: aspartyl protease family protein [Blastocatellia bacterium]